MNQNLWWPASISWSWIATGMTLSLTTNRTTHLTLHWTLTPPVKLPFYRIQRGVRTFCGYTWKLLNTIPFPQNEAGLQTSKTFTVQPWVACNRAWWYIQGDTAVGPSISTSIIYTGHFPGVPGPSYPAAPEQVTDDFSIIRAGNHYTFWANDTWYALCPLPTNLRIYKRTPPTWTRMDQLNEPTPPAGVIRDVDSRLSSNATIHAAYHWRNAAWPPDRIYYATFDTATDAWVVPEIAYVLPNYRLAHSNVSLALDADDAPHLIFPYNLDGTHKYLSYGEKTGPAWSAIINIIAFGYRTCAYTSLRCSLDGALHALVINVDQLDLFFSRKPLAAPWAAYSTVDNNMSPTDPPSVTSRNDITHVLYRDRDNTLAFALGPPPWTYDLAIAPAVSRQPNILAPQSEPQNRYAIFVDVDNSPDGRRWQAPAWGPFPIVDPDTYPNLSASLSLDIAISYLASRSAPVPFTNFNAFPVPS